MRKLMWLVLLVVSLSGVVQGQSSAKIYRGSLGDKHIEIRLSSAGSKVTGSYFYDQFKQAIPLEGAYDGKGQLELLEGTGKTKTGKFICKPETDTPDVDLECEWSRPDGTRKSFVYLVEQSVNFKNGTEIVPVISVDRKTKAFASYPQLKATTMTEAMNGFNRLVLSRLQTAMKEFDPETVARSNFDTNYNVLLATDDIVSVEMVEYSDTGGAHPNTRLWTVNYDLKTNKELTLKDVFRDEEYKNAIAEFAAKDISRRADEIERSEAKQNNRQPEKRDQPFMTADSLPELDTFALSPKGFVAYFDFPHVMAVFDKTVVPYGMLARHLKPNGVVPVVR